MFSIPGENRECCGPFGKSFQLLSRGHAVLLWLPDSCCIYATIEVASARLGSSYTDNTFCVSTGGILATDRAFTHLTSRCWYATYIHVSPTSRELRTTPARHSLADPTQCQVCGRLGALSGGRRTRDSSSVGASETILVQDLICFLPEQKFLAPTLI